MLFILGCTFVVQAQSNYRTWSNGNWSDAAIWRIESPNGSGNWIPTLTTPDFTNANNILVFNAVQVTQNVTIDQTSIRPGASVTVLDGVSLGLNNGSGTDFLLNQNTSLHLQGEGNLAGNGYAVFGGDIYLHSTNNTGAITLGTGSTGNIRNLSRNFTASCRLIFEGSSTQYIGNGHPANAILVINNTVGVHLNNTSSSSVTIGGNVFINAGSLNALQDNFTSQGEVIVNGGQLVLGNTSGVILSHSLLDLTVLDGEVLISTVGSTQRVSVNVNGNLNLTGGDLDITSGVENIIYSQFGDITGLGSIIGSGTNNNIRFYGSGNFTNQSLFETGFPIEFLTVSRPGLTLTIPNSIDIQSISVTDGNLVLTSNQVIRGSLNLATGTSLDFSNVSLDIRSAVGSVSTGGNLIANSSSNLTLNGSTSVASVISFAEGSSLSSLTLNRNGQVTLTSPLTIFDQFTLVKGPFVNSGVITAEEGLLVSRNSAATLSGAAISGGPYNVLYNGGNLSSGLELLGNVGSITSSTTGTMTLTNTLNISESILVTSGIFAAGSNAITADNLTNQATFNAPTTTLTLTGNLMSTGNFVIGSCDLYLTGSNDQSLTTTTPITFNDIVLQKSGGIVRVNSNQNISGTLTLSENDVFDADGISDNAIFTLLSLNDGPGVNANIAALPSGASVIGNVSVQRTWGALDNVYRYISSPVANGTIAQLQSSGIPVTGNFVGTSFPCTGCTNNYVNLGWYDEDTRTAPYYGIGSGYQIAPASGNTGSEILVPTRGYEIYMWNGVQTNTWIARGSLNQGSYPFSISYVNHSAPTEDGWNLVGNPYPSSIVWEDNVDRPGSWTSSNVSPIVWVWDVAGNEWLFYDASTNSGPLTNGIIAAGQGFWIQATGTPSLTIHEQAKTTTSGAYYRSTNDMVSQLRVSVSGEGTNRSSAFLTSNDKFLNVPLFQSGKESVVLGFADDSGTSLARLNVNNSEEYPLILDVKVEGEFKLSFAIEGDETEEFSGLYLIDKYLTKSLPLSDYSFIVTGNQDTYHNRFYLSRKPLFEGTNDTIIRFYPNPVVGELHFTGDTETIIGLSIYDSNGQLVINRKATTEATFTTKIDMSGYKPGLYFIKVVKSDGSLYIQKILKQ